MYLGIHAGLRKKEEEVGMAPRKTTKAQPRQKQAPATENVTVMVLPDRESRNGVTAAKNGHSPSFEQIQLRAYEIFEARGRTHGCDLADWLTAEQELLATRTTAH
jgi:Protein of unknown function (DUF2934)